MEKQIKFTAYDATKTDIDSIDGEIAIAYGLTQNSDGAYHPAISMKEVTRLPEGYKIIALHSDRAIVSHESTSAVSLYYANYDKAIRTIDTEDLINIGEISDIKSVAIQNNTIVLATSQGLKYIVWCDGAYSLLEWRPELPTIEFGLQRIGTLSCGDRVIVKNEAINGSANTGQQGSGASQTHPTTSTAKTEKINLSQTIMQALENALDRQVRSKGCFDQPFFVRYALRMRDGNYPCISPPILMLPTVLPPRIGINQTQIDESNMEIAIDLSANNVFELRYRISEGIDPAWHQLIDAIDVFISDEIKTYRTDKNSEGYLTSYTEIVEASDSTSGGRGRHYGEEESRAGESSAIFDGHYSLGEDNYVDHTFEWATNHGVWFVNPNTHLSDDICTAHKFYRVASIPYSAEEIKSEFSPLHISTTDQRAIIGHVCLPDQGCDSEPLPDVLTTFSDQIVMACDRQRLVPPSPLRSSIAYIGNASAASSDTDVDISVYVYRHGSIYKATVTCRGFSAAEIPRYIYYPDPSAFMMTVTQGANTYALPLTRHEHLQGAYWWGGLSAECMAQAASDIESSGDIIDDGVCIYTSTPANPLIFESNKRLNLGECHIIGLCGALMAPEAGIFGEYPMYAFSDSGIMMLRYDHNDRAFTSAQCIGDVRCINPLAIASARGKVIFATTEGLFTLSGSSIRCISEALETHLFDLRYLPHFNEILTKTRLSVIEDDTEKIYERCLIHNDKKHDTLVVSCPDKGYSLLYSLTNKSWSIANTFFTDKIYSHDGLLGKQNTIVELTENIQAETSILITRPIKITKQVRDTDVLRVEILGDFAKNHVSTILYGATRLNRWHLIASSKTEIIDDYNVREYRYLRIACICNLEDREYVHGALITIADD